MPSRYRCRISSQSFNRQYANKLLLSVEEYNPGAYKGSAISVRR